MHRASPLVLKTALHAVAFTKLPCSAGRPMYRFLLFLVKRRKLKAGIQTHAEILIYIDTYPSSKGIRFGFGPDSHALSLPKYRVPRYLSACYLLFPLLFDVALRQQSQPLLFDGY